jgi:hypothetical protein
MTDPYGHILGFLDRTCCVNTTDNTHYAPITTKPSTRTKYLHKISTDCLTQQLGSLMFQIVT